jgi:hypothetical protein
MEVQHKCVLLLDGGAVGPGIELSTDEDARRELDTSLERAGGKVVTKTGCRHE